jgi:zinc D-Ala-D-Ala carboxypeptidase
MSKHPVYGYFLPAETRSKDGHPGDIRPELRRELNKWREKYGHPIHIVSGYRSQAHNRAVGGALDSFHTQGLAADIHLPDNTVLRHRLLTTSFEFNFTGRGFYRTFIHVDMRQLKGSKPAYWIG